MTKPEPCESSVACELGSPKYAKIVTTPGDLRAKIVCGSKPLAGIGPTLDVARAGSAAGAVEVGALTTTVRVSEPNQPAPFPMPNAAPPPRTAATRVTAARGPARIRLTVAAALRPA